MKNSLVIDIQDGSVGYTQNTPLLRNLTFKCYSGDRVAIEGANGSGKTTLLNAIYGDKTTLLNAIYGDKTIFKTGFWQLPTPDTIGYLQQNYPELDLKLTVWSELERSASLWHKEQLRQHLNTLLFYKHEELEQPVATLSGGEKVRLSLAKITANPPAILSLDEITNNIDLTTREYLIQILSAYTETMIVISHDELFLQQIGIISRFILEDKQETFDRTK